MPQIEFHKRWVPAGRNEPGERCRADVADLIAAQIELDEVIAQSADKRRKLEEERAKQVEGPGLAPADEPAPFAGEEVAADAAPEDGDISADDIFKNFSG